MNHPELKCSVCEYIPDDIDIEKTDYKLNKCDNCGKENVCDLCLFHTLQPNEESEETNAYTLSGTRCPACDLIGKNRKKWLQELY